MRGTALSRLIFSQLLFIFSCLFFSVSFAGLDAPHDDSTSTGCLSCHDMTSTESKYLPSMGHTSQNIDDTVFNNLCWSCHQDPFVPPTYMETHSSLTAGSKYGNWTVECWVCHNQHTQEQNKIYGSTYGKFIRAQIDLANITGSNKTGTKKIKFTNPSEFAHNDAAFEGICEACHTVTTHWSKTAVDGGNKHFSSLNCLDCHPHNQGMKAVPPDHATLVQTPTFCQGCHTNTIFGLHNSSETGWVNCDRCHDKTNNYALNGFLPLYLKAKLTWNSAREKEVLAVGQARCDECHQGQYNEHIVETGTVGIHNNSKLGYDLDGDLINDGTLQCDACHFDNLVQEHSTRRKIECSACHESTVRKVIDAISKGRPLADGGQDQLVFCNNCHNTAAGAPAGNLIANHHLTPDAVSGECTKCHIVGPGERGPRRPPCWYCHGEGKPGDPQRSGVNRHANGPAITDTGVDDFRVCFSCHLDGGQGFRTGITPPVTPMHGLPGTAPDHTDVYWPYGYYRDAVNTWQTPVPLMPTPTDPAIPVNLENDPARWLIYSGWHVLNYLGETKKIEASIYNDSTNPTVQDWARSGANSIRNLVQINYMQQDYPTVPITLDGSNYEIPSFDGTGTIGKPTGSGSVSVTISPAAAVTEGAQWRLDGQVWQDSGTTLNSVTDRTNHLLEFKLLAGWAEPQQSLVTINNGQTTTVSGRSSTYTTCGDNRKLTVERTTGIASLTFDWTSPDQIEAFTVTNGWLADEVTCEIWKDNGASLEEATGFAVQISAGGDSCQLLKDDITLVGTYNLVLRMTGSSCFRNSTALNLTVTVTPAGAPSPIVQSGGIISQPFLNSLALPTSADQNILHLAGDLYVHLNNSGTLSTFTIDSSGNISPVIGTTTLLNNGVNTINSSKMVRVNDDLIAVTYSTGPSGSQASHVMSVGIEQNGTRIHTIQDYRFYTGYSSLRPRIYPHNDAKNIFILSWIGTTNLPRVRTTGLLTIDVSQAGIITELDRNTTMPDKGVNWEGNIIHVTGSKYGFLQAQDINIFEVNAAGAITVPTTPDSTYRFTRELTNYGEIIRVKGDIFTVAYTTGPSGIDAGVLKTISITDNATNFRTINSYLFEPCSSGYVAGPSLTALSDTVIGVSYFQYSSCDGQQGTTLKTIEIKGDGRITVPPLGTLELAGGGNTTPKLYLVSGDIYAFLLNSDTSEGVTFNGVKTYTIIGDNDADGIVDSSDNCRSIANAGQADQDGDGVGDACDQCPGVADSDVDGDGLLLCNDPCPDDPDNDIDGDGICGDVDVCPTDPTNDADNDGLCGGAGFKSPKTGDGDNCPAVNNADQADSDCNGTGDACSTPVYYPPVSVNVDVLSAGETDISWKDVFTGENGYRIERKAESCSANTLSFAPVTSIYQHDDFNTSIDPTAWTPGSVLQYSSDTTTPILVSDASGSGEVSWEKGAVKLRTVSVNTGDTGYNYSYLAPREFKSIIGDKDFDIQVDFSLPNGTINATEYHTYARLGFYFSDTDGNKNSMFTERWEGGLTSTIFVNGVMQTGSYGMFNYSGKIRLKRKDRKLSGYAWDGTQWRLLVEHTQLQTADLVPTWFGVVHHARRNDPAGHDITVLIDNFRFNSVGTMPQAEARLLLDIDESSWQGIPGEVRDSAVDGNHGTAFGGVTTISDSERGTIARFDGVDDYVEISGTGTLENLTDTSFTFTVWAKPMSVPPFLDDVTYNDLRGGIMARPGYHTSLGYTNYKSFHFAVFDDTPAQIRVDSLDTYETSQWHHLAGVVDDTAKTVKLYVDGQLKNTKTYTGNLRDYGTLSYFLGSANPQGTSFTWFFDGMIDDARIFDRALSATEVGNIYSNNRHFQDSGLTAGTTYCYRIYPFKNDTCTNWSNHGVTIEAATMSPAAANATTAGNATAIAVTGAATLRVTMPYFSDNNNDNTYTVEYKLSSDTAWSPHLTGAIHVAGPFTTNITALTPGRDYDVRVTYIDTDGVNGMAQQTISNTRITPGRTCLEILQTGGSTGNGVYLLDDDGDGPAAPFSAYCDMTTGGGGWTLVMKLDGSLSTFEYAATYWTTTNTLNPGSPDFDTSQAKLQSFNTVPFTEMLLGMQQRYNAADDIDWITISQGANSALALFRPGTYIPSTVGRTNWINLLDGVIVQDNCNQEGFNQDLGFSLSRIGIAMNGEANCSTPDSIIGFGNRKHHPFYNADMWEVVGGGMAGSNTPAYGWILVR